MTPEQRSDSDLREKTSNYFEADESINEAADEKIKKDVTDIASVFSKSQRPWFLGGGVALELHNGEFRRTHGDYDVFIYKGDIETFIKPLKDSGYDIFRVMSGEADVIATQEQIITEDNFHLKKTDDNKLGPAYIDLWLLEKRDNEDVIWDKENNINIPKNLFVNASKYISANGREVPLQPKEMLILNKLFKGRQSDLNDLRICLPTLTEEERWRLNEYLNSADAVFIIGNRETSNLEELLQLAEVATTGIKESFLATKADEVISEHREKFNTAIAMIFEIARRTTSPEVFLEKIKKEFDDDIITRRKSELDAFAKFLFENKRPTQEEFREFAYHALDLQKYLERALKIFALDMQRWKIRVKGKI